MPCVFCNSNHQAVFAAEVNIHVPSSTAAACPGIFVFPQLLVCMSCGTSSFVTPAIELGLLAGTTLPLDAATVREQPAVAQYQATG